MCIRCSRKEAETNGVEFDEVAYRSRDLLGFEKLLSDEAGDSKPNQDYMNSLKGIIERERAAIDKLENQKHEDSIKAIVGSREAVAQ